MKLNEINVGDKVWYADIAFSEKTFRQTSSDGPKEAVVISKNIEEFIPGKHSIKICLEFDNGSLRYCRRSSDSEFSELHKTEKEARDYIAAIIRGELDRLDSWYSERKNYLNKKLKLWEK